MFKAFIADTIETPLHPTLREALENGEQGPLMKCVPLFVKRIFKSMTEKNGIEEMFCAWHKYWKRHVYIVG